MGNVPPGMGDGSGGDGNQNPNDPNDPNSNNNNKDDDKNNNKKKKKRFEPRPASTSSSASRRLRKRRGPTGLNRTPTIAAPTSKCKLRLYKLERIKDFLLLEQEFITNQTIYTTSPEERELEEYEKLQELRGTPLSVGSLEEMIDDNHCNAFERVFPPLDRAWQPHSGSAPIGEPERP